MPTGKDFTPEQWREINAVRSRLEAYRDKIQPYPALPEEEIIPIAKVNGLSPSSIKQLEQLRNEVRGWRQKHAELLLAIDKMRKPKRQPKYS